jgi:hypothetical protein
MRESIKRNPLGIRKLDVQQDRREMRRASAMQARQLAEDFLIDCPDDPQQERAILNAIRVGIMRGFEEGIKVGALRTRNRVGEAIASGKLVKS